MILTADDMGLETQQNSSRSAVQIKIGFLPLQTHQAKNQWRNTMPMQFPSRYYIFRGHFHCSKIAVLIFPK